VAVAPCEPLRAQAHPGRPRPTGQPGVPPTGQPRGHRCRDRPPDRPPRPPETAPARATTLVMSV